MIHLVTGGSGSGKSEYAENWLMEQSGGQKDLLPLIYVATMMPYTEETKKKIERHHRLRAGKGFRTIEKYTDMYKVQVPENKGILLECISNLTANELYREDEITWSEDEEYQEDKSGSVAEQPESVERAGRNLTREEETVKRVVQGVRSLAGQTEVLVIVTNEVNSDINGYSEETEKYRACIGRINQELAKMADRVTEVVYGIPVPLKGSKV